MKKIIIPIGILVFGSIKAQLSTTENYVQTKVYLDYNGSQPTKTSETVQYFDGLGRPKQIVNVKASPLGKDVVTPVLYDGFGRQTRDYLAVPQSGTQYGGIYPQTSTLEYFPVGDPQSLYTNEKPFSEKILENSPLDRIQQQIQVGAAWAGKAVKFDYGTNTAADAVKMYIPSTTWENAATKSTLPVSTGVYPVTKLYKNTMTDEDGNKTIEFKNGRGQVILVRKVSNTSGNADTYYVYNEHDQLVFVIPPTASILADVNPVLNDLCYQYRYDEKNRLVEKKLPGKGWEYMVYDKADRLIMTQDANMRPSGNWVFTRYDKFSRVAYTGISAVGVVYTRKDVQDGADYNATIGTSLTEERDPTGFSKNGMIIYYGNTAYPSATLHILTINYYDTYPRGYAFNPPFPDAIQEQPVAVETSDPAGKTTRGLPVMSLVKNIEDDNWTKTYSYYDHQGRVIGTHVVNHLGGYTRVESELDFAGLARKTVTRHKRLETDAERLITENFTYDHQNRLLVHRHQVDTNPEEILTQNKYNELSQLESKKVGGVITTAPLQQIDYQYNIRGWMTKLNDPANLNGKLFGFEMRYNNPVYTDKSPAKYNGNIAEVDWKNSYDNVLKRYNYEYDSLNRLKNAFYKEPTTGISGNFDEYLTYDANGNISNLKRTAIPVSGQTSTLVDNLDYQYAGNRLTKVIENALNDTGYEGGNNMIDYDQNGNMINMKDKGIQSIVYNHLNLPNSYGITQNDPLGASKSFGLEYMYRADGVKIRKTNTSGGGKGENIKTKFTDYLDGFQYNFTTVTSPCDWCRTSVAYEQEAYREITPIDPVRPRWILDFVPTSEGFYSFTENRYIYQYKDHLGNARVSFTKGSAGALDITDINDYYAFGLNHIGGIKGLLGGYSSYKYNGKELQETGMYDYGARMYMADIGRWGVIDLKGAEFPAWSPYNYSLNNPIRFIDPDGMAPNDIVFINNRGVEVHRIKSDTQFKTYIQASANASRNPAQSNAGWKSVPMPNIIQHRPQSNEDVSGADYQGNDYQIAARTGYFNQAKNSGQLNLVTEGGNSIPNEATKDIPDLDPTLVKAITVQESNAGTTGLTDIMQANVPGDWSKMKSSYQLSKGEKTSETNSLYAGTRVLATKGFKGGVSVDSKTGKVSYKFQGWSKAVEAYNGGGTAGYQKSVLQMQQESKKPKPSDY
ncbi:DUF6443 domain-containing protein [Chryseobacterium sp. KMC2]|nr:DUF6443 domain-containing protein [Chryseobacterium sp. KMC2]MBL3550544.1 RHS repeat-associated core domain-containing protein [Chryseobacterium sp. KMC2]